MSATFAHAIERYAKRPNVLGLRLIRPALNNPAQPFVQHVFVHVSLTDHRAALAHEWRLIRMLMQHARRYA